jgi:hypothetical protein
VSIIFKWIGKDIDYQIISLQFATEFLIKRSIFHILVAATAILPLEFAL